MKKGKGKEKSGRNQSIRVVVVVVLEGGHHEMMVWIFVVIIVVVGVQSQYKEERLTVCL